MAFSAQRTVAYAPTEVARALASEDFHRSVIESLGGSLVSFERDGDVNSAMTVTTVRTAPADRLPEKVAKFVGDTVRVEQVERWDAPRPDGSRTGTTTITIPLAKATAEASMHLQLAGESTDYAVQGSVSCRIPLVGSKLAAKAEPMVGKVIDKQAREIEKYLGSR
ncbi:MAG: DUF2505 domain-containing protein [Micrococcus sp.]|nr:DUF2505 domain-containing protein [Micrococcus sp.]